MPRYIHLRETASTNTYLARMAAMLPSGTVIYTNRQSAGRGQRGNSWESEPGKNVTFSLLVKEPKVKPSNQFYISEAASLAITDYLSQFASGFSIKWPNDIYHGDKKICGILIEHSLQGNAIKHTIIGAGININQLAFVSDAPNPVSLAQILGREIDIDKVLHDVCEGIERYTDFSTLDDNGFSDMHKRYLSLLYRNDGEPHTFALPGGGQFSATITDVCPDGTFCLLHADGTEHSYAFKEVSFVL